MSPLGIQPGLESICWGTRRFGVSLSVEAFIHSPRGCRSSQLCSRQCQRSCLSPWSPAVPSPGRHWAACAGKGLMACAGEHTLQRCGIQDHTDRSKPPAHAKCEVGLETRPQTVLSEIAHARMREMSSTALPGGWKREERPRLFSLWIMLSMGEKAGTRIYFRTIVNLWSFMGYYGILKSWQDRKIQPRNCKVAEQQNTKEREGLTVKRPVKKNYTWRAWSRRQKIM